MADDIPLDPANYAPNEVPLDPANSSQDTAVTSTDQHETQSVAQPGSRSQAIGNFQATSTAPPLERQGQARAEGYNWDEIDAHLAEIRAEAGRFGYSQSELDAHQNQTDKTDHAGEPLSFGDQDAAFERFTHTWQDQISQDPGIPDNIANPSKALDSGGQSAALFTGNVADDYARSLLNGEVKGPNDFAALMAQAYYKATDSMVPGGQFDTKVDQIKTTLMGMQAGLVGQLPTKESLVDTSIQVAQEAGLDTTTQNLALIQHNLINHWADTGEQPMDALSRAMQDPAMRAKLTGEPYAFTPPPNPLPVIQHMLEAGYGAGKAQVTTIPDDISAGLKDWDRMSAAINKDAPDAITNVVNHTLLSGLMMAQFGFAGMNKMFAATTLPQIAAGTQLFSELFPGQSGTNTPEESAMQSGELLNMANAVMADVGVRWPEIQAAKLQTKVALPISIANTVGTAAGVLDTLHYNANLLMNDIWPRGMQKPQILDFGNETSAFQPARPHDIAPVPPMTGSIFAHEPIDITPMSEEGTTGFTKSEHNYDLKDADGATVASLRLQSEGTTATVLGAPKVWFPYVQAVARDFLAKNTAVTSIEGFAGRGETGVALTRDQVMREPAKVYEALGASPHEVVNHILNDALEHPNTTDAFDDAVGKMKDTLEGLVKKAGASVDTQALARGYDLAARLHSMFRDVIDDESGALSWRKSPTAAATSANAAARTTTILGSIADRFSANPAMDMARSLIQKHWGLSDQELRFYSGQLESAYKVIHGNWVKATFGDDYERNIRLGPAGNLANDPIHLMDRFIDGRGPLALNPSHPLTPVAVMMKNLVEDMHNRLYNVLGKTGYRNYIDNVFNRQWERPAKANNVWNSSMLGKGLPTRSQGIEQGLVPKADRIDVIHGRFKELQDMSRFIAAHNALGEARNLKVAGMNVIERLPKGGIPSEGYTRLEGQPNNIYAADGFAQSWNRFINKGGYLGKEDGSFYRGWMHFSNTMTALKLAFPTYHALAMMQEAMMANLSVGLGRLAAGDVGKGLLDVGSGIFAPVGLGRLIAQGRELQRNYLTQNMAGDPLATLFAQARGRVAGRQDVYKYTGGASLLTALERGVGPAIGDLTHDIVQTAGKPTESIPMRWARFPDRVASFAIRETIRTASLLTGADFLFDKLVPWIKQGAFGQDMQLYLDHNSLATQDAKIAKAREISASMDNRFGELNQNNLFWKDTTKKFLNAMVVSLGWEYGSLRAFGNAAGLSMSRSDGVFKWNPTAMRWLLSFGMGTAYTDNLYQYFMTGKPSWATNTPIMDNFLPRNGGQISTMKVTADGRSIMPGYLKDALNFYRFKAMNPAGVHNPLGPLQTGFDIVKSKFNPAIQLVSELLTNQDAIGHTLSAMPVHGHKPGGYLDSLDNYLNAALESGQPIPYENLMKQKKGSGIGPIQTLLGIKAAPSWAADPEGWVKGAVGREQKAESQELNRAKRENAGLVYPDEELGAAAAPAPQQRAATRTAVPPDLRKPRKR